MYKDKFYTIKEFEINGETYQISLRFLLLKGMYYVYFTFDKVSQIKVRFGQKPIVKNLEFICGQPLSKTPHKTRVCTHLDKCLECDYSQLIEQARNLGYQI